MKKLFITAFLLAAFAAPFAKPRPPLPPYPGPTKGPKPPIDCKIAPRPCPPLPGK